MHFNQSVANVNLIPESPTGASASALLSLPNDRSYSLRSFLESSSAHESLAHTHDAPSTFTTFSSYPSPHAPPPCLNNDSALSAGALSASRFLSSSICRIISAYASLFPLLFSPALATGVIVSAIAADAASATHARANAPSSAPRRRVVVARVVVVARLARVFVALVAPVVARVVVVVVVIAIAASRRVASRSVVAAARRRDRDGPDKETRASPIADAHVDAATRGRRRRRRRARAARIAPSAMARAAPAPATAPATARARARTEARGDGGARRSVAARARRARARATVGAVVDDATTRASGAGDAEGARRGRDARDYWFPVCFSANLRDKDALVTFDLFNVPWVLFRGRDGEVGCVKDECCHRACPLSLGKVVDGRVQCPYHGWEYETNGECVKMPSCSFLKNVFADELRVIERDGMIFVWAGESDPADFVGPEAAYESWDEDVYEANEPGMFTTGEGFVTMAEVIADVKLDSDVVVERLLDITERARREPVSVKNRGRGATRRWTARG